MNRPEFSGPEPWDEVLPGSVGRPTPPERAPFPKSNMPIAAIFCLAFATSTALHGSGAPSQEKTRVQVPPVQAPAPAPGNPVVVVSTTMGEITLELFKDQAPVSVENFVQYARERFYDGTIFHRVKSGYVVQGGGYTAQMVEKSTRPPILNEATNGLKNARGTVAMARMRALRSATSQFYINLANNRELDHRGYSPDEFGYAVFGRVIAGMDVVDKIAATPTGPSGDHEDVPLTPIVIQKVTIK
jgi:cyclophilin family peptidyl-prolyl cis-trans isomerase